MGHAEEPWPQLALHLRRDAVVVDEDVEAGVYAVLDEGVEFSGVFHLGEFLHDEVLFVGGHVLAGEVEAATRYSP